MGAEHALPGRNRTDRAIDEVREFLEDERGRPFAIYTHWLDTHIEKRETDEDEAASKYRHEVKDIDARLGLLVELLEELEVYDETLVIRTADHGYGLGEGGKYFGKQGVGEFMVRVPMVLHVPGLPRDIKRVHQNVSGLSVAPTILDVLAPDAERLVGAESLMGLLVDPDDARRDNQHAVVVSSGDKHAVRRGRYKLIVRGDQDSLQLFDLQRDRKERSPIDNRETTRSLRQLLSVELKRRVRLTAELVGAGRGLPTPRECGRTWLSCWVLVSSESLRTALGLSRPAATPGAQHDSLRVTSRLSTGRRRPASDSRRALE